MLQSQVFGVKEFAAALRQGPYAWPGGYAVIFLACDGESICYKCAHKNRHQICESIREHSHDGWRLEGAFINYEDPDDYCANCNEHLEPEYKQ